MYINLFDSNVHSDNSPGGEDLVTALCEAAVEKEISGICITDLCEMDEFEEGQYGKRVMYSCFAAKKASDVFARQLIVTAGVEICQPHVAPERALEVIGRNRFDFVLGSLHKTRKYGYMKLLDYADPALDMQDVFRNYYTELLEVVKWNGFDSLAHLGYPLRYMRPQNRSVDLTEMDDIFAEIMKTLVQNGKALELNTGGLRLELGAFTPSNKYLKMYKDYGGELITLGSDALRGDHIGYELQEGMELLKSVGFKYFTFFKERRPVLLRLL